MEIVLEAGLKEQKPEVKMARVCLSGELTMVPVEEFNQIGLAKAVNGQNYKRILIEVGDRAVLLTEAEKRVFDQIMSGRMHKETAFELETTEKNIKFHCGNIYRLFGVSSKIELMAMLLKSKS